MQVVTIETPSLGDRSYLVHDGTVALVVDPQRDVDRVLEAAEAARRDRSPTSPRPTSTTTTSAAAWPWPA